MKIDDINISLAKKYCHITWNAGTRKIYDLPSDNRIIKASYGSALINPSLFNTYVQHGLFDTQDSGKTHHSYFLHLPNPALRHTRSQNVELNIQQYKTDNFSITIDGYYTRLIDLHAFADVIHQPCITTCSMKYLSIIANVNCKG